MKINSRNVKEVMALSPMQESMLFYYLTGGDQGKYIAQICYHLTGNLNVNLILKSWDYVISHNDVLRTVFRWECLKQPIQIVLRNYTADIQIEDLRGQPLKSLEIYFEEEMEKHRRIAFDITESAYRIKLYQISNEEIYMLVSSFSIIYDGWSNSIMLREFLEIYNRLILGSSIAIKEKRQFVDYIVWLKKQSQDMDEKFWRDYLGDLNFPNIRNNIFKEKRAVGQCQSLQFKMPKAMECKVKEFIVKSQVTLASVIYAIWALWIYKSKGIRDVVFGITVSGRPAELTGIEEAMGVFINTVPLRIKISPVQSFYSLARKIHEFMIRMKEYENYPLSKIKACSGIAGDKELFDTIVVMQNYPINKNVSEALDIDIYKSYDYTDFKVVMGVLVWESVLFDIRYCPDIIKKKHVQEIQRFTLSILQKISANQAENTIESFCESILDKKVTIIEELKQLKEIDIDEIF